MVPFMPLPIVTGASQAPKIKKLVAVAAGKGGVGKSTVCAGLARAAAVRGLKVGVLDADVYGPSVPILFPADVPPKLEQGKISPAVSAGIKVLSVTHFGFAETATAFRAPVVNMFLQQCIHQVDWGELDVLFVDFPPGVGDVHLCLLQEWAFSGVVLVTLPNRISLSDVEKACLSFLDMGVPVCCVLENMAFTSHEGEGNASLFGSVAIKPLLELSKAPLNKKLPFDPKFTALIDQGDNPYMQSRLTPMAAHLQTVEKELFDLLDAAPVPDVYPMLLEWKL